MELALDRLSPYVRLAMDYFHQGPWFVGERQLWDYEILYLKEGELRVTVEDIVYQGLPGDIFIFKPGERHSIRLERGEAVHQPHIHFDLFQQADSREVGISFKLERDMTERERGWFRPDILSAEPLRLPSRIRLTSPVVFEKLLFDLIAEYQMKLPFYETNLKGIMIKLFIHISREQYWSTQPQLRGNMDALLRIQQILNHQLNRGVSLDELAAECNISKYHLIRQFKAAFGMSPIQYHRIARLEKAKQLLQLTNLPLGQIAEQLGFQSIHTFSRYFKMKEKVAPSYYRGGQSSGQDSP